MTEKAKVAQKPPGRQNGGTSAKKRTRTKAAPKKSLSNRQRRFCVEYLVDLNATQAAIRAGYSAASADPTSRRLLGNARIQEHLALLRNVASVETKVTPERVIAELAKLAFADPRKLFGPDGCILPPSKWPDDVAAGIAGMDVLELDDGGIVRKVKRWDKTKALELLGRYLALFKDKVEVDIQTRLSDLVLAADAARKSGET